MLEITEESEGSNAGFLLTRVRLYRCRFKKQLTTKAQLDEVSLARTIYGGAGEAKGV
jgi:O-glycosyl hydrolase